MTTPSLITDWSPHYLAYIALQDCAACHILGMDQVTPTTVHHISNRGISRKCPDFWTIPLCADHHLHGAQSIDRLGKKGMLDMLGVASYEVLALIYLRVYMQNGVYKQTLQGRRIAEPRPKDGESAAFYLKTLEEILDAESTTAHWAKVQTGNG